MTLSCRQPNFNVVQVRVPHPRVDALRRLCQWHLLAKHTPLEFVDELCQARRLAVDQAVARRVLPPARHHPTQQRRRARHLARRCKFLAGPVGLPRAAFWHQLRWHALSSRAAPQCSSTCCHHGRCAPQYVLDVLLVARALRSPDCPTRSCTPLCDTSRTCQVMNTSFDPFALVNTYGAFGSITKDRHEIVLQVSGFERRRRSLWMPFERARKARAPPHAFHVRGHAGRADARP